MAKLRSVPTGTVYRLFCSFNGPRSEQPGWSLGTRVSLDGMRSASFGPWPPGRTQAPACATTGSKGKIVMSYVDDAFDNLKSHLEITRTESEQAQIRHRLIRSGGMTLKLTTTW